MTSTATTATPESKAAGRLSLSQLPRLRRRGRGQQPHVLAGVDVPAAVLHRRRRHRRRSGRHGVARGEGVAGRHRHHRRPGGRQDQHPVGPVPPLPPVRRAAVDAAERGPVLGAGRALGWRRRRVCLCQLRPVRPGLQPGQYPLRVPGVGDDPAAPGAGQAGQRPNPRRRGRDHRAVGRDLPADHPVGEPPALADHHHTDFGRRRDRALPVRVQDLPRDRRTRRGPGEPEAEHRRDPAQPAARPSSPAGRTPRPPTGRRWRAGSGSSTAATTA
jgi:hypothetical protein